MQLSEFILTHLEQILSEWVVFARSCRPTANKMDYAMLRDHASEMLRAIATDIDTRQSKLEQADKSKGKSDANPDPATPDSAAQAHGAARADSGFDIEQMVSEYRALRATVTRLWIETAGQLALKDLKDLIRFNEAIDQALAESTSRYTQNLTKSKDMFLAMLGHDLRSPLGAVISAARMMVDAKDDLPPLVLPLPSIILGSGQRMFSLVNDLLDFTRCRLGGGIPIVTADMDIEEVCRQTVLETATLHPQRVVNFEATGDLHGHWDRARISQTLSNVINNAVRHGSDKTAINVTTRGEPDEVTIAVQNWGPVIPTNQLNQIFDPMHRLEGDKPMEPRSNLGLGLYITERIVAGHGGWVGVESSEEKGTIFTIHLPKRMRSETPPDLAGSGDAHDKTPVGAAQ